MSVTIDTDNERYVIAQGVYVTFDECIEGVEAYAMELVGRGKLPGEYIDKPIHAERGTIEAYRIMINLRDEVVAAAAVDGETPVTMMTPFEDASNEVAQLSEEALAREIFFAKEALDVEDPQTVYWLAALYIRAQ